MEAKEREPTVASCFLDLIFPVLDCGREEGEG